MNLFRRLWNLARALLRPRKPFGSTEPEPPTVEDLRADIRVRQLIADAIADKAGWRVTNRGDHVWTYIQNGHVVIPCSSYVILYGEFDWPRVGGVPVKYRVAKRHLRKVRKAAFAAAEAELVRKAAEAVGGKL